MSDAAALELVPDARRLGPGRPSIYTPALAEALLARYAAGEPIKTICASDGMPAYETYRTWKWSRDDFRAALTRARADKAEILAERPAAHLAAVDPDSPYGSARVSLAREKVAYDLWLAGKLDRDTYGERPAVEVKIGEVSLAFARLAAPTSLDDD